MLNHFDEDEEVEPPVVVPEAGPSFLGLMPLDEMIARQKRWPNWSDLKNLRDRE